MDCLRYSLKFLFRLAPCFQAVNILNWLKQLENATLQVYKDGDYGGYLDVEASLNEQVEELDGFLDK